MQISVHKKAWMNEEDMFYLHTVCSEKKLFIRATNTILGIFETRFERLYCCHGYHVTEHVLLSLVLSTELIMEIGHRTEILKADVSSVSPSSERIEGLWVTCSFYSRVGATL